MTVVSLPGLPGPVFELDRPARRAIQGAAPPASRAARPRKPRRRTLVLFRWIAVAGQTAVLLTVHFGLGFAAPLAPCLLVIGLSAGLNLVLSLTRPMQGVPSDAELVLQIGFDIAQSSVLLAMTGGMNNPFVILLIGPVALGAAALPSRGAITVAGMGLLAATTLKYVHLPLPWADARGLDLPYAYEVGMWAATMVGMSVTAGAAWASAREAARMELALATAQHVLAQEQRLSELGALAAAAAHELGTPLATIQVVAAEMARAAPPTDPAHEDARLLVSQAQRCRDILKSLSREPRAGDRVVTVLPLAQLLEEIAEAHRGRGPDIVTGLRAPDRDPPPVVTRSPEIVHALTALVDNAVDFARSHVILLAVHDARTVTIEVADDGPGFAPSVLARLGEPYVTTRPYAEGSRADHAGMGLGFFIAKTLLERTGAVVNFRNGRRGGAVVCAWWPRDLIEASAKPSFGSSGRIQTPRIAATRQVERSA